MRRVVFACGLAALVAACESVGGLTGGTQDAGVPFDGSTRDDAATNADGSQSTDAGASDAIADADSCAAITENVSLVADTMIAVANCQGALHYGPDAFINIGTAINSKGLFRFALSSTQSAAFAAGTVRSLTLALTRCTNSSCVGAAAAGTLAVFPMRSDWDEGAASVAYSGADWCRRTAGSPGTAWNLAGASGAVDVGTTALGSAPVDASQPSVSVTLAPAPAVAWMTQGLLSLQVVPTNGAVFVTWSREAGNAPPPTLTITYCKPPSDAAAD